MFFFLIDKVHKTFHSLYQPAVTLSFLFICLSSNELKQRSMIETALIIAAGIGVVILMTSAMVGIGLTLDAAQKRDATISDEQYRAQLRRNYEQMHRCSDTGLSSRFPFRNL